MTVITAIASVILFTMGLWAFGVLRVGAQALGTARGSLATLRDPRLDDTAREQAVQAASLRLFGAFFSILLRTALVLLAAALPLGLAGLAGLAAPEAVVAFLLRWDVIALTTLAMLAGYVVWRRLWATRPATPR
jgi:hypothetical protein